MKKKNIIIFAAVLAAWMPLGGQASELPKPNIVLIISDDMGYADVPGFGPDREIPMPHFERMVDAGTRFSAAYVTSPVCSPSRAGIMTGRYPPRWRVYTNPDSFTKTGQTGMAAQKTFAEYLQSAGYATAIFGKWHLDGNAWKTDETIAHPENNGFDEVECIEGGMARFWAGTPLYGIGKRMTPSPEYLTDQFGKRAVDFIERRKSGPFALVLAFTAPHAPLDALDADLEQFAYISDSDRRTYGAMMHAMDRNIGRVLDALEKNGVANNTMVAFVNDNGGPAPDARPSSRNSADNGIYKGHKYDLHEGGTRVPMVLVWPGRIPAGRVFGDMVSSMDLAATFLAGAGIAVDAEAPLDGVDLLPWLTGEKAGVPHEMLFWRYPHKGRHTFAVRSRNRLLWQSNTTYEPDPSAWEYYHLDVDPGETSDLSAQFPERVSELAARWHAWRTGMQDPVPASEIRDLAQRIAEEQAAFRKNKSSRNPQ